MSISASHVWFTLCWFISHLLMYSSQSISRFCSSCFNELFSFFAPMYGNYYWFTFLGLWGHNQKQKYKMKLQWKIFTYLQCSSCEKITQLPVCCGKLLIIFFMQPHNQPTKVSKTWYPLACVSTCWWLWYICPLLRDQIIGSVRIQCSDGICDQLFHMFEAGIKALSNWMFSLCFYLPYYKTCPCLFLLICLLLYIVIIGGGVGGFKVFPEV